MKILLATFLVIVPFLALAQEEAKIDVEKLKHPVKPALWKIEGKDLAKPSYLFGTIHLGDPRVVNLHPEAEKAFNAADRFYAEIKLDPESQLAQTQNLMRKDGKTLSESIGPKLTKQLDAALQEVNPAFTSEAFGPMKTWVISMTLPLLEFEMAGQKALDLVLYERAMKEGKKVGGVESTKAHFKIFDDLTEAEQIELLEGTLKYLKEEDGKDAIQEVLELYLTADARQIGKELKKQMDESLDENDELSKRLIKALLDDRNVKMTKTIAKRLTKKPQDSHFFAIGTAHYTGPTAIQDLLSKKGYTITPVFK